MAVFSKFAVSVAAVAVGYEEESLGTASALQMKKTCQKLAAVVLIANNSGASGNEFATVPIKSFAPIVGVSPPAGSGTAVFKESLPKKAPAIPSKDESQLLVTLKEKLTAANRKKLIDQYDEESFYEALQNVEECTQGEKESLWKVWELFREANEIKKGKFWDNVQAIASKGELPVAMFNDKSCNLLSIVDKLEAHLCEIMEKEEKRLKEQLSKAGAVAMNVGLGFGVGALLLVALCCVCHIMEKYCQPEPPCRACAAKDNQV